MTIKTITKVQAIAIALEKVRELTGEDNMEKEFTMNGVRYHSESADIVADNFYTDDVEVEIRTDESDYFILIEYNHSELMDKKYMTIDEIMELFRKNGMTKIEGHATWAGFDKYENSETGAYACDFDGYFQYFPDNYSGTTIIVKY